MTEITEHECIQHARGDNCGPVWYQGTVDDVTIGSCGRHLMQEHDDGTIMPVVVPFVDSDLPLSIDVDQDGEMRTIVMRTANGDPVTAVALPG